MTAKAKKKINDEEVPEVASIMPVPTGYRMLVVLPDIEEKTEGGIIRPDEFRSSEERASIVGLVLKMGPDCYADPKRFPSGPWCKEGQFVMFRAYSGTRFNVKGKELRLMNDDSIEAVVADPRGVTRSY